MAYLAAVDQNQAPGFPVGRSSLGSRFRLRFNLLAAASNEETQGHEKQGVVASNPEHRTWWGNGLRKLVSTVLDRTGRGDYSRDGRLADQQNQC